MLSAFPPASEGIYVETEYLTELDFLPQRHKSGPASLPYTCRVCNGNCVWSRKVNIAVVCDVVMPDAERRQVCRDDTRSSVRYRIVLQLHLLIARQRFKDRVQIVVRKFRNRIVGFACGLGLSFLRERFVVEIREGVYVDVPEHLTDQGILEADHYLGITLEAWNFH